MANIASVLKDEIARISRKEVRGDTEQLRKSSAKYRSEIATLKRRVTDLEQQVSKLLKVVVKNQSKPERTAKSSIRFSADRFKAYRQRIGLSAQLIGKLLEVSGQTIYSWESGKSRPSGKQLEKISALRGMGKREISRLLEQSAT